jgi:cell division protein ZapA
MKVNICGIDYILSSDDDEAHVKSVVDRVSEHVDELLEKNKNFSIPMAATLAALDFCDRSTRAVNDADSLRAQIKEYLEDLAKSREALKTAEKELENLKHEIGNLRNASKNHNRNSFR